MTQTIKLVERSVREQQPPLFTKLNISTVLNQRLELALEQFAVGSSKGDICELLVCMSQRFWSIPIRLAGSIQLQEVFEDEVGKREFQYGFRFTGDPIFWECSPDDIHDLLPEGLGFDVWNEPPGETMRRPRGECFRNDLIIVCDGPFYERDLDAIRELLKQQALLIDHYNKHLMQKLTEMAANYA